VLAAMYLIETGGNRVTAIQQRVGMRSTAKTKSQGPINRLIRWMCLKYDVPENLLDCAF